MHKDELSNVIISPDSSIRKAIEAINSNGVRGVFICEEDQEIIGIVMDSDIRRAILRNNDLNASLKTIMKTSPVVIDEKVPDVEKKRRFIDSNKMLIPIVDKDRRVVDFIFLGDVIEELTTRLNLISTEKGRGILPPEMILVVGGAGYIGSVLVERLLRMGYRVRVLDLLLYGKDPLHKLEARAGLEFVRGDCRSENTIKHVLENVDAVVHLGEIVGDPACQINEAFTIETNYSATHMLVDQCLKNGIKRFIFSSSCSVYGKNDEEINEKSELNPVSLYARCKIESERAILSCGHNHMSSTILRLATVHGRSYRQRFDLVVNALTIKALTEKKIQIFGGKQWRPFISVQDVGNCIIRVLQADRDKVANQVFNVGDYRENYQLSKIGSIIEEIVPEVTKETLSTQTDARNYKVNFDKIRQKLGFAAELTVVDTVKELVSAYRDEKIFHDYKENKYYNYQSLR